MSKNNYIKQFVNLRCNFETTKFLSNKYYSIYEKYLDIKYYDDVDDDESKDLEYELKHFNKLLCSSIYNDYNCIERLSDSKGLQYKNKDGFKNIYKRLKRAMTKEIFFEDGNISLLDFLTRNRIRLNHPENKEDEKFYIDYYNLIISYKIYDYLDDVIDIIEAIIVKIEKEIGEIKIRFVKNSQASNQIITINYFNSLSELIKEIMVKLKHTQINVNDYEKIRNETKILLNSKNQELMLNKDEETINNLKKLITFIELKIEKYNLISKRNQKKISSELYLLNIIFNNNSEIVVNLLVQLSEILNKILNDITVSKEKMLNNLLAKKEEFYETMVQVKIN